MSIERRRTDCPTLPRGWKREEVLRKSGLSKGRPDVYYYSPTGRKFRSKSEIVRYLGDAFELSNFDYYTGKNVSFLKKPKTNRRTQQDFNRSLWLRNESGLSQPQRQTASIFKQPVTLVLSSSHQDSSGNLQTKPEKYQQDPAASDKPQQLFWMKRLEGLRPCDMNFNSIPSLELPQNFKPCGPMPSSGARGGPGSTGTMLVQSLSDCLHRSSQIMTGQTGPRAQIDKNPAVYVNPEQPFMQGMLLSDEDIRRQEQKVKEIRQRLQETLDSYPCRPHPKPQPRGARG